MGGVENYTYNLAKQLIKKGHRVTIVTSNTSSLQSIEEDVNMKVYRMPCFDLMYGRLPILKFNREFFYLNKLLKKETYDFAVINTRFYIHSLYGVKFAKKNRIPSIIIEHGTSHLTFNNKFLDFFENIYEHMITKLDQLYCQKFCGVSKASNEWIKHFNINASDVLYNAIDLERINSITLNENYRKKYKIDKDAIVITFTGRLIKEKGILTLCQVINEMENILDNLYLCIAGDGPLKEEILKLESDRIILLGRLTFEEVISLLKESDIFCLPSDSEGFSSSVLEAAACKNYIITTRRGGSSELLIDDSFGKIINENDYISVYNAILDVYKKERMSATEKTYKMVEENFTWEKTADKLLKIIDDREVKK